MRRTRVLPRRASLVLAGAFLLTTVIRLIPGGHRATARPQCQPVHGHFSAQQVERDGNPNTLEAMGPLHGGLQGVLVATEVIFLPSRPETPNVLLFTERVDITTKRGSLLRTIGTGSINGDSGLFTELLTVIEGDGEEGFFGELALFGKANATGTAASGDYRGELCF